MITIYLSGALKTQFGNKYSLAVSSVKEAVNALSLMVPNFKEEFLKYDYLIYSKIDNNKVYLGSEEIAEPLQVQSIYIVPKLVGNKSNTQKGVGKLLVAAALFFVAGPAAIAMAGGATAVATSLTAATTAVKVLATLDKIALFIALSGVSSLLTPDPPKEVASKESSSISTENTVTGVAVPLAYGEGYFDVLPISVEIASSGMMQGQYGNGGFDFNLINGGFKWTNPEYENPIV